MMDSIDDLLTQYEIGKLSRRDLLAAIALLLTPAAAPAQDSLFRGRSLNDLKIRPVVGAAFALDFPGGGFISLCPLSVPTCGTKQNAKPGDIDHFGVGIHHFDAARIESQLKAAGFDGVCAAGTSVFVADPDGTMVQLSAADQTYSVPPVWQVSDGTEG